MRRSTVTPGDLKAPLCPCCSKPMRDNPADNANSRYRDVYICGDCGVREAFEGDFWTELFFNHRDAILIADREWRQAHATAELLK